MFEEGCLVSAAATEVFAKGFLLVLYGRFLCLQRLEPCRNILQLLLKVLLAVLTRGLVDSLVDASDALFLGFELGAAVLVLAKTALIRFVVIFGIIDFSAVLV